MCVCSVRHLSLGGFLAWHDLTALRLVRGDSRWSPWGLNGDLAEDEHSTAFLSTFSHWAKSRPALSRGCRASILFMSRFQLAFRGAGRLRLGFKIRVVGGNSNASRERPKPDQGPGLSLSIPLSHRNLSLASAPPKQLKPMPPPLRPFPLPSLSIGTDIAHIPRIAKLVASQRRLPRFLRKLFTAREERAFHLRFPLSDFKSDSGSFSEGEQQRREDAAARYLAGRWAAKEAVVKACSWRRLMFDEIQILKDEESRRVFGVILDRPEVKRAMREEDWGRKEEDETASEALTEEGVEDEVISGQVVKISISHDGDYATAVCLAAEETNEML